MGLLKSLNVALAFVLELAMLAALGYFGYRVVDQPLLRWVLALALPAVVAVLWGMLLAPKAANRLAPMPGLLLALGLFLLAALALQRAGQPVLGAVLALAAVVHVVLAWLWRQW